MRTTRAWRARAALAAWARGKVQTSRRENERSFAIQPAVSGACAVAAAKDGERSRRRGERRGDAAGRGRRRDARGGGWAG